jgi:hypothetical protein
MEHDMGIPGEAVRLAARGKAEVPFAPCPVHAIVLLSETNGIACTSVLDPVWGTLKIRVP